MKRFMIVFLGAISLIIAYFLWTLLQNKPLVTRTFACYEVLQENGKTVSKRNLCEHPDFSHLFLNEYAPTNIVSKSRTRAQTLLGQQMTLIGVSNLFFMVCLKHNDTSLAEQAILGFLHEVEFEMNQKNVLRHEKFRKRRAHLIEELESSCSKLKEQIRRKNDLECPELQKRLALKREILAQEKESLAQFLRQKHTIVVSTNLHASTYLEMIFK